MTDKSPSARSFVLNCSNMKLGCISSIVFFFSVVMLGTFVIIPMTLKDKTQSFHQGEKLGRFAARLSVPVFFIQHRREKKLLQRTRQPDFVLTAPLRNCTDDFQNHDAIVCKSHLIQ
jgi:hypothetical protein